MTRLDASSAALKAEFSNGKVCGQRKNFMARRESNTGNRISKEFFFNFYMCHLSLLPYLKVYSIICDVSDAAQVDSLATFAAQKLGTIHIWINNAGR